MKIKRLLCALALLWISITIFSVYGPWDIIGAYNKIDTADYYLQDGAYVSVQGKVKGKELKNDKYIYYLSDATINIFKGSITNTSLILNLDSDDIPIFSYVKVKGNLSTFSTASNQGNFDGKKYYNSMGYVCKVEVDDIDKVETKSIFAGDYLYKLSSRITEIFDLCLPGEEAGFLSSITLGDKSGLNGDLKELFQNVGVAHVLAVSGLHVSVVCIGLYNFLRKRGISFVMSGSLAGIIAVLYGIMTGLSVSAYRACGMFLIYLLSQMLGESYDMLTSLSLLASILLLKNPLYVTNSSFIFSFLAVLFVILFAKPFSEELSQYLRIRKDAQIPIEGLGVKYRRTLKDLVMENIFSSFAFSFFLTLATIPLTANFFYQVPIYSVLLNLVILPLMPFLLLLGLAGGFIGILSLPLGQLILYECHILIYFYEMVAAFFEKLPRSVLITGHHNYIRIILYWLSLVFILYALPWIFKRLNINKLFYLIICQILLGIFVCGLFLIPERQEFEIDILDVGQGDGTYISSGDGLSIFIDGGSTSSDQVGKYNILPFLKYKGCDHIDYWFISHSDEDHISGLMELLECNYQVDNIVLSSKIVSSDNLLALLSLAKSNNTNVIYINENDKVASDNITLTCLFPTKGYSVDDANAMSLSILLEYRDKSGALAYKAFFGGDIGADEEKIIAADDRILDVNMLKVSHHGSKYSSDSDFLLELSPDIATISCAKKNYYGHPAKEAVDRIEETGAIIYYTMDSGQIIINENSVTTFK